MKESKKMIQIGMMKIMPIFDTPAWGDIEERFGSLKAALAKLEAPRGWQRPTAAMATILCNRALEEMGEPLLEEKKVMRMIPPSKAYEVRTTCLRAIGEGCRMEHKAEDEGPVDLVLREIEKKAEPAE